MFCTGREIICAREKEPRGLKLQRVGDIGGYNRSKIAAENAELSGGRGVRSVALVAAVGEANDWKPMGIRIWIV